MPTSGNLPQRLLRLASSGHQPQKTAGSATVSSTYYPASATASLRAGHPVSHDPEENGLLQKADLPADAQLHIQSARKFAYKRTTNSRHSHPVAPNLLNRNFQVSKPNTVWVGDITYIPTGQGWLYLAIVKDLCTKKVVGYAFSNRIDTALTLAALRMAVKREHPAPGLMFHSDRGVQYAAAAYREKLEKLGFVQSMSRKGEPHDNAVAENFFSCLKCELVYLTSYATRRQAQNSIFRYIEGFYNPVRPHSSIDWLSPMEYARQLNRQNVA